MQPGMVYQETTVDVERYKELAAEAEKLTVKEKSEKLAAETREKKVCSSKL